jgi:predicted nucleic acid-binding Zn ribbon protein
VGHGLCLACYKQARRGIHFCVICDGPLPKRKSKTCSTHCEYIRALELQRVRRAKEK